MAKTHLQHLATASAINLIRVADWLADRPRAQTRRPLFERVLLAAALFASGIKTAGQPNLARLV